MRLPKRGFSLIEAVVALGILSLFVGAILAAFPTAFRLIGSGRAATVAAELVQAKIESLRQVAYGDLTLGTYQARQRVDANPADPFYDFYQTVTVTAVDDSLSPSAGETGLKQVTVTLEWTDPERGPRSADISTLVTAY